MSQVLAAPPPASVDTVWRLPTGVVLPYPLDNLFRGWTECTEDGKHLAIDIGGVGPDAGLGTPVRSMGRARVVQIGEPEKDPALFGELIDNEPFALRGGRILPTSKDIPGYGKVHFFTRTYGTFRTGRYIAARFLDGPLAGMTVRYMHLAAIHPGIELGTVVFGGQEIGLLGGTAVLEAGPHIHVDIDQPGRGPIDVGEVLGIGSTRIACNASSEAIHAIRARFFGAAQGLMAGLRAAEGRPRSVPLPSGGCGHATVDGDFLGAGPDGIRVALPAGGRGRTWYVKLVSLEGAWSPKLGFEDAEGRILYTGAMARPAARKRWDFRPHATGQNHKAAEVAIVQRERGSLNAVVSTWPVGRWALAKARWRLELNGSCQ